MPSYTLGIGRKCTADNWSPVRSNPGSLAATSLFANGSDTIGDAGLPPITAIPVCPGWRERNTHGSRYREFV